MPTHYNNISIEELKHLMNSNSLFGRKFTKECYQSFVNNIYMNMLQENKDKYELGFQKKLEDSEKLDKNLGRIMRNIYNLNIVA